MGFFVSYCEYWESNRPREPLPGTTCPLGGAQDNLSRGLSKSDFSFATWLPEADWDPSIINKDDCNKKDCKQDSPGPIGCAFSLLQCL